MPSANIAPNTRSARRYFPCASQPGYVRHRAPFTLAAGKIPSQAQQEEQASGHRQPKWAEEARPSTDLLHPAGDQADKVVRTQRLPALSHRGEQLLCHIVISSRNVKHKKRAVVCVLRLVRISGAGQEVHDACVGLPHVKGRVFGVLLTVLVVRHRVAGHLAGGHCASVGFPDAAIFLRPRRSPQLLLIPRVKLGPGCGVVVQRDNSRVEIRALVELVVLLPI